MRIRLQPSAAFVLFSFLALPVLVRPAGAQGWLSWTDETSTRLVLQSVTVGDTEEKDMIADDFDRDGDEDLVVFRKRPFSNPGGRSNVLLMNENGTLVERTQTLAPDMLVADDVRDVLSFDANGDGWLDLCTATTFGEQPKLFVNQGNDAGGNWLGFVSAPNWAPPFVPGPKFCAVYEGDVDNDGDEDLYFSDYDSPLEDQLLINDGTGTFTNETAARFPTGANDSVFGTASFVCDMNNDGWNDIVKVSGMFEPLKILFNDQNGVFTLVQEMTGFFDAVYMARVGDFDNDGRLDIFVVDDNEDYILYNNATLANGTIATTRFTLTTSPRTNGFGGNTKAADLDRDGFLDLGVCDVDVDIANCNDSRLAILRNEFGRSASRSFSEPGATVTAPWNTPGTHDVEFFDIDGDGFLDAVVGLCTGYRVFIMDPTFAAAEAYGTGCGGAFGVPAMVPAGGVPSPGNLGFRLEVSDARPNAPTLLFYSPLRGEAPIGNGCSLLVDPVILGILPTGTTAASGTYTQPIPIQNLAILEGLRLDFQIGILDPGSAGGLFSLTNGVEIYISSNLLP